MKEEAPVVTRAEYLIAIKRKAQSTGLDIAKRALADALEEHWEEGAASRAWQYVSEQFQRVAGPKDPATGELLGPTLYGFQLELTEEVDSPALVIKDVSESLRRDPEVEHVIKFFDSLVEEENLKRARELFTLEMRLRRAISFIYLYSYGGTYYDLLRNDALGTDGRLRKRMPKLEELRAQSENEFFHLLFNHYGELNVQRETRQLDDLIKQLAASANFAALQRELQRMPVEDEDDRKFLDRIKRDLNPAEELRNCVMHSRAPTDQQIASYETARDALHSAMDEFFQKWAIEPADDGEWPWDTAARDMVEQVMESARWNEENKTIELPGVYEPHAGKTVASRDELVAYLEDVAENEFYANCSRDDGEYISECDENDVVESVLAAYDERLTKFFPKPQPRDDDEDDENPKPEAPST
jgi:hypothetical protein